MADGTGNVYVTDSGNYRVQKFDSSGTYITGWGSMGSGDGEFNVPVGIAIDNSGYAFVTDLLNQRVQSFRILPVTSAAYAGALVLTAMTLLFTGLMADRIRRKTTALTSGKAETGEGGAVEKRCAFYPDN